MQACTYIEHLCDNLMCERAPHEISHQPAPMEDLADGK